MGLPQVSSSKIVEESAGSFSIFVPDPPRFASVNNNDLDGMHRGTTVNQIVGDILCSSLGDFQRKTILELPECSDGLFKSKCTFDASSDVHGLKTGSMDKNDLFIPKVGQKIQSPVSRIVGFDSGGLDSFVNGFEGTSPDRFTLSAMAGVATGNEAEPHGSRVRNRMLSPLNGMLYPYQYQFDGDPVDNGGGDNLMDSPVTRDNFSVFVAQDHEKTNIGHADYLNTQIWSVPSCQNRNNMLDSNTKTNSILFTDGPLLENSEPLPHNYCLSSPGFVAYGETSKVRTRTGEISISSKNVISPLSLSPLGPKVSERTKSARRSRDIRKEIRDDYLTLKTMNKSLDGTLSFSPKEEEFSMTSKSFQGLDNLEKDSDLYSPESTSSIGQHWCPDSAPASQFFNLVRSSGGLPARRFLVGSFEESLLSGRFSSAKLSQRVDGFLAVLNVTGGNFSPPSRKLPFAVTSVCGDNYLLYYASIDLTGNFPSYKCRGSSMLSNDDSRAAKSRLRIPIKGCIQLIPTLPLDVGVTFLDVAQLGRTPDLSLKFKVLSNPEKTPLHTFFCNYDLSDMPAGTKFHYVILQLESDILASKGHSSLLPISLPVEGGNGDFDMNNGPKATPALKNNHPSHINREFTNSDGVDIVHTIRSKRQNAEVIGNEGTEFMGCICGGDRQKYDLPGQFQCNGETNSLFSSSGDCLVQPNGFNLAASTENVNEFNSIDCQMTNGENCNPMDTCHEIERKSIHSSSKVNESTSGAGVLRYALHLRFLCPTPKKCSRSVQRCHSDPIYVPETSHLDNEGERHFYLYNDLRVVFPQRQLDADEGKLNVEYHCPGDPKYFDITN